MIGLVLAIRPEPGCSHTARIGRMVGLPIECCPLFEIAPLAWDPPSVSAVDGLLIGSANAFRHGGSGLDSFREKPVYAVGAATARIARAAGFDVAVEGRAGLQPLLDRVPRPFTLLRLAGAERVPLNLPLGVAMETRTVYESITRKIPQELAANLRRRALVLLHSAAAARHFAQECDRCAIRRSGIALCALGSRIADAAGQGWREVRFASEPREAALLALARDMCHEPDL